MKSTAKAYAIQGLIKYHGLRNEKLRIPYHDSISVCMKSLPTRTTVEARPDLTRDRMIINGQAPSRREFDRAMRVVDSLRILSKKRVHFRIESKNPDVKGKGLGFSAAGFAALGLATSTALGLQLSSQRLSEIVRLGAGSAARSVAGGFSIWYANKEGRSYAEMLAPARTVQMKTIIVPLPSQVKTDTAHVDAVKSPFYNARVKYVAEMLSKMKRAINQRNIKRIAELTEIDTLNLHAVTMTGAERMVLFNPLSIRIIEEVQALRREGMAAWYSLDTGPSVFVNTDKASLTRVNNRIGRIAKTVVSDPGGPAEIVKEPLF